MAQDYYDSYGNKRRKIRNRRYFFLAVVVLVVGAVIIWRGGGEEAVQEQSQEIPLLPEETEVVVAQDDEPLEVVVDPVIDSNTEIEAFIEEIAAKGGNDLEEIVSDVYTAQEEDLPAPGGDTEAEALALIAQADREIAQGNVITARDHLNKTLEMRLSDQDREYVKTTMAKLSAKWLFSRDVYSGDTLTMTYKVQAGDLLSGIAKEYNVPYEFLQQINNIKRPELLQLGQVIKVVNGPFHVIVHRPTFTMDLYLSNKMYVKSYKVGLGVEGKETPTGRWRVKADGKLIRPSWPNPEGGLVHPDDPEYPLGSRWIGLDGLEGNAKGRTGFGIHGTKEPETIGTRSSQGCIRLYNGHVIEVYDMLMPGLSEVRVTDD